MPAWAAPDSIDLPLAGAPRQAWLARQRDPSEIQVVVEAPAPQEEIQDLAETISDSIPNASVEEWVDLPTGGWVQVRLPVADLGDLARLPGVGRVREPRHPSPHEIMTEGYAITSPTDWQAEGLVGRRVDIAVLDIGFAGWEALEGEELPSGIETVFRSSASSTSHGTAVAEIIHDLAPNADLALHSFSTDVEFLAAIEDIALSGVDLVNGSVGFDNYWPADGSGPITRAVDEMLGDAGILYVAASGNENGAYRHGPLSVDAKGRVSIDGLDVIRVLTNGSEAHVSFRWDDPTHDIDLFVSTDRGLPCGSSEDPQDGSQDPHEEVECQALTTEALITLVSYSKDLSGSQGWLWSAYDIVEGQRSEGANLSLPGDTLTGLTVGAVEITSPDQVSAYSSRGPTEDGRFKPDLVAPSGVSTATLGAVAFVGTSAATPHATGAAALVLQADRRHMDPAELLAYLRDNAIDIGEPGLDDESGHGRLQLGPIPWRGCHCATNPEGSSPWALARILPFVVLVWVRRSRCVPSAS